jgi:hypothetical protein
LDEDKIAEYHDEASACRDSLMLQFVHLESTAKKMSECARCNPYFTRNILVAAKQFLHRHMFTLQMLPRKDALIEKRRGKMKEMELEPIVANTAALKEKLQVLLEHEDQLRTLMNEAMQEGKSEEALALHRALVECREEIGKLNKLF